MKIDKTNPVHWWYLMLFGLNAVGAMLARPWWRRGHPKTVVLYGHKLCGNLLAIHRYWQAQLMPDMDMVFLTMDKACHRQLRGEGVSSVLATRPSAMGLLARADAVISDHGLHVMGVMAGHSSIKFFDVWHGIMFKGFAPEDFSLQHRYTETWAASPLLQKLYVDRFGFQPGQVEITGYARTDALVRQQPSRQAARQRFNLPAAPSDKIILVAPTWQHDPAHDSIYPFGVPETVFLQTLSTLAVRTRSTVVLRTHLNSRHVTRAKLPGLLYRSFADWPDTETLLLASDVLVCDWSSIAFDWLVLNRPTVFMDVSIPTSRGFALGPEYRFGDVVASLDILLASVAQAATAPKDHLARFATHRADVLAAVYGSYIDGQSSARCLERLRRHLFSEKSSR